MVRKEFIQLRRDRLTFAMMIGIPLLQLTLFGYAINGDPKQMPTALVSPEASPFSRSLAVALTNTGYFNIRSSGLSQSAAEEQLARGEIQFIITLPAGSYNFV